MSKLMEDQEAEEDLEAAPAYLHNVKLAVNTLELEVDMLEAKARSL